jgi:glycerol kinase
MNTGCNAIPSAHGLLTTVAYQVENGDAVFALEGSISYCGSLIQWLRDNLCIISDAKEIESLAAQVTL